jgi:hypothetical protein
VPVLVLSATAGELCELRAFAAGAHDFQPASVSYLLLRARLGALIARSRVGCRDSDYRVGMRVARESRGGFERASAACAESPDACVARGS